MYRTLYWKKNDVYENICQGQRFPVWPNIHINLTYDLNYCVMGSKLFKWASMSSSITYQKY